MLHFSFAPETKCLKMGSNNNPAGNLHMPKQEKQTYAIHKKLDP
jgi:hypothetical protein